MSVTIKNNGPTTVSVVMLGRRTLLPPGAEVTRNLLGCALTTIDVPTTPTVADEADFPLETSEADAIEPPRYCRGLYVPASHRCPSCP